PAEPGREGMAFLGWYADGVKYDFSAPVMGDLHLVAKFGLLGDMNLDGALNTMDALLLFGCVNGAREMTAEQEAVADYTEDGNINMMDALMLYGFASGANSNLDDSQKALSDMNSDGTVNMVDALLLYKVASGR
ncbi:MAG: InlB B-repeat-containing protein, partial [Clostridia bacterium]|nr:InlB B-repeat-containing protein [Clostridia bacterium]